MKSASRATSTNSAAVVVVLASDLPRIEAGKIDITPESVNVARSVDSLLRSVEPMARQKGLALKWEIEPGTPERIDTDAQRLGQILKNLLSNALKFTERGEIRLRVFAIEDGIGFAVRDTGIGIAAEALGIDERMIHRGLPLGAASTGLWSVFVPLLDAVILDGLEPDLTRVHALSDALGVGSIYAYAPMGVNRFAARDFAPALGIPEDPVTGSAGGALMALLVLGGLLVLANGFPAAQRFVGPVEKRAMQAASTFGATSRRASSAPRRSNLLMATASAKSSMSIFSSCEAAPNSGVITYRLVSTNGTIAASPWPMPEVSTMTRSKPDSLQAATTSGSAADSSLPVSRVASERMYTRRSSMAFMRMRSPSSAPPEKGDEGSTAMTATFSPFARRARTSASVVVDLPTPGAPVMPTTWAPPVWGASAAMTSGRAGCWSSTSEMSRPTARDVPALASSTRTGTSMLRLKLRRSARG